MQRERRLRRSADFAAVYRRGRSASNEFLTLRALPTGGQVTRVGFSVGKRVGKAVVRNRVKRRLRAAAVTATLTPGWDVVVVARPAAATARFASLQAALTDLVRRLRLLPNPGLHARDESPRGLSAAPMDGVVIGGEPG